MFEAVLSSPLFWGAAGFVAGMLVGSNNPTWLNSKWKDVQKKADDAKADEFLKSLAEELKKRL